MPQTYFSLITNQGLIKEAASNEPGGTAIDLTEMAVGDSNGAYYDPDGSEISLANEVHRVTLTHVVVDENNTNQLIVEAVLDETIGPFYIREVGIFDSNGDLFAIGKYPETFKPNLPEGSGKRLYIRMILGFANSPNVNLVINNDISLDPNFGTDVNNALAERLVKTNNLSDLENLASARNNLEVYSKNEVEIIGKNKNLFINGLLEIWQRGTSETSFSGGYLPDRFCYHSALGLSLDASREIDTPNNLVPYSYKLTRSLSGISTTSDVLNMIYYGFEGHDIFMYRNKPITLSFSVKSNKTGTFVVSFRNSSSNKSYLAEYTINQTDVWERKTITITLEDILWAQDNSGGLYIRWIMGSGSNFENAVTNSWIAGDIYSTPNQTQLFEDSGDYFQIAEFMLNEGTNSYNIQRSSFDFSAELSKCQRYLTPWEIGRAHV